MNSAKVIREHLGGERVVWTIDAGVVGPVIGLTANIHGDESTGVVILNQILEQGHLLQKGKLRIFPSLNPEGWQKYGENHRSCPDLNRLFNCGY